MDRVRRMLERGVAAELSASSSASARRRRDKRSREPSPAEEDEEELSDLENSSSANRRSIEGRAIFLLNRINGLALGMTKLRAFRERQSEVFKVLAGVSS